MWESWKSKQQPVPEGLFPQHEPKQGNYSGSLSQLQRHSRLRKIFRRNWQLKWKKGIHKEDYLKTKKPFKSWCDCFTSGWLCKTQLCRHREVESPSTHATGSPSCSFGLYCVTNSGRRKAGFPALHRVFITQCPQRSISLTSHSQC